MSEKTVQEREAEFWDDSFARDSRSKVRRWYAASDDRREAYKNAVMHRDAATEGPLRLLEIGVGRGSLVFDAAAAGHDVTALDISPEGIRQADDRAKELGLTATFTVGDAEDLPFEDDTFDVIYGSAIIHHLVLSKALPEAARVLRPGGRAVWTEPQAGSPPIQLYRKLTPKVRTPDEHPLVPSDYDLMRDHFSEVHVDFYDLVTPFAARASGGRLTAKAKAFDDWAFRRSGLACRWAWYTLIIATK